MRKVISETGNYPIGWTRDPILVFLQFPGIGCIQNQTKKSMKQLILLFAAMSISCMLCAQKLKESEVPPAVKTTFKKSFPNAKGIEWSKESENEFEAEFKNGKLIQAANFDAAGKWLATETKIKKAELPSAAQATIKKDFPGFDMEEVEKVETPDKGMFYEVKLEKGEKAVTVEIAADGKVLKKEEGDEKEEGEKKEEKEKKKK
jgi:hypothetical protein